MISLLVVCEACGKDQAFAASTEDEAVVRAVMAGWRLQMKHRGRDLCPACKNHEPHTPAKP